MPFTILIILEIRSIVNLVYMQGGIDELGKAVYQFLGGSGQPTLPGPGPGPSSDIPIIPFVETGDAQEENLLRIPEGIDPLELLELAPLISDEARLAEIRQWQESLLNPPDGPLPTRKRLRN